jgi:hypothetical protein
MTSLTWRQVTAWRLSRQHLLERAPREHLLDVVSDICCLHAQMLSAAELQVWTRVRDVSHEDVRKALWSEHTLVKTWAMRGTLHLLTAADFPIYVAALSSTRTSYTKPYWLKYFNITLDEMHALIEGVRAALNGRTLTREQLADEVAQVTGIAHLRDQLLSGWGTFLKPAAAHGYLCFGPTRGQSVTFARPDQWIGPWEEIDPGEAVYTLARRFLTAYGPATRDEFARWLGIEPPKAKPIFQRMAEELQEVDIEGTRAFALADNVQAMGSADEPNGSVRLLPNFDPYTLSVTPHSGYYIEDNLKPRVYRKSAWITPVVLVDGRIAGVWAYEKRRGATGLKVELFERVPRAARQSLEAEAALLGDFLGAPTDLAYEPI